MNLYTFRSCLLLIVIAILTSCSLTSFAQNRYWVASSTASWSSNNWSSSSGAAADGIGPPLAGQVAIFNGSGIGDCTVDKAVTIDAIRLNTGYTGTLDLNNNTFDVNGSNNNTLDDGIITDLTNNSTFVINSTGQTIIRGTVFNAPTDISSGRLYLHGSTFNAVSTLTKTGGNNDYGNGGNIFNANATIIHAGTGYFLTAGNSPDVFNGTLELKNTGSNILYVAHNALNNQFNGNIVMNATSGNGIRFGQGSAPNSATLAAGNTLSIGTDGYSSGNLEIRNFNQLGNSAQNLPLTGGLLSIEEGSTFNGAVNFSAPRILTRGTIYNDAVTLSKTGASNDYSAGNNTFNAAVQMNNSGSGYFAMGNTNPDAFNNNLTINNTGGSRSYIAYNSVGNIVAGDLVLNNTPSVTNGHIYVCNANGNTLTVNGNTTAINNGTGANNRIYLGIQGSITFNGRLDLQNIGSGNNSGIYLNHNSTSNNQYTENIIIASTGGYGVRFGESTGSGTLAATKTITVGANGFSAGQLQLRNFTQTGATAQNLTFTGTGMIYCFDANFGGNVNFIAPRINTRGTTYQGSSYLEKTGASSDASAGGNTFTGNLEMVNSGSNYFLLGNGTADIFNANVTLRNTGTHNLYIAHGGTGHQIAGDLIINQTASGASSRIYLAQNAGDLTVNGNSSIINNGSGNDNRVYVAYNGAITFNGALDLQNIGSGSVSAIYLNPAAVSSIQYNENITVSSTSGNGIQFGQSGGAGTLAATKTITVGAGGYTAGYLLFRNFTQVGPTPQNLSLTGTSYFYNRDSDWGGDVTFRGGRMYTNTTNYQGTALLEKTGAENDASPGGNTFAGHLEAINSGSGYFLLGNGTADLFNANVTLRNTGTYNLYIAHGGAGHQIAGDLTIHQTTTGLNCYTYAATNTGSTLSIGGQTTVVNNGTGTRNNVILANNGAVTFTGVVDAQNIGTGINSGIYFSNGAASSSSFQENIIVASTGGQGVRFGNGGGASTLAATKTVTTGATGFSAGQLRFRNFTQIGPTPQALTLTGTGYCYIQDSDWGGNINFVAPRMITRGTNYQGTLYLEKTGAGNDYSAGGNTVAGNAELLLSGIATGRFIMGNGTADIFNDNLLLRNTSENRLYAAHGGAGHLVNGSLTINVASDSSGAHIYVNNNTGSTLTVNGPTTVTNTSVRSSRAYVAYHGHITFNNTVTLHNSGTAGGNGIYLNTGGNSNNTYNENIVVTSDFGQGIRFGQNGGLGTLAATKTVTVGPAGFSRGRLYFRNFTQVGTTVQSITLTDNARFENRGSNWGANVTFIAPRMYTRETVYNGTVYLEKTRNGNDYSYGGNTFHQQTELVNSRNGQFVMGNNAGDIFNADLLARNIGRNRISLAHNSPGNQFNGKVYFYNLATDNSNNDCLINHGANATSTFADSAYFVNTGVGRNRFFISNSGQATFNGPVVFQNFGNHNSNIIYINSNTTGSIFNNNITVESTIGVGIYFGTNGGASTLNPNYTITLGPAGFALGRLRLRNFTQLGNTPQAITLTGTALLEHYDSEWNAVVNFVSPRHFIRGTTFNNTTYLEKQNASSDYSYGGNIFNGSTTLHVTGTGRFVPANNVGNDFNGDVIFRQSSTGRLLPAYNAASTFAGNINLDYIPSQQVLFASAGNGRAVMDGANAQTLNDINNSQDPFIRRLEMNKSANSLTINVPVTITHELNLLQGNINTTHTNLITMNDNSVVPTVSNASYVNGPIEKLGNDAFIFPVGKGGFYREIHISAPSSTSARFRAEYFLADPHPSYDRFLKEPSLDSISPCEYWILDRHATTNSVVVSLSFNSATSCGAGLDLKVARWDGALWRDHGNGGMAGNIVPTAAPVTNFSPFTLTVDTLLNLPVELLSFEAERNNPSEVQLDWITATELNNAGFEVQRMLDNETEFTTIDWVDGVGNSNDYVNYRFVDPNAYPGVSYYRLRQVDFDGTHSFSEIRAVSGEKKTVNLNISIYPNPVSDVLNIHFDELPADAKFASVKLISLNGQVLHQFEAGVQSYQLLEVDYVKQLPQAAYVIHIKLNTGEETMFNFVKQ